MIPTPGQFRAARSFLGLTQVQMAYELGISHTSLLFAEQDKPRKPVSDQMRKYIAICYKRRGVVFRSDGSLWVGITTSP